MTDKSSINNNDQALLFNDNKKNNIGEKLLSSFKFQSNYAKFVEDKNVKETWEESVDRIFNNMHGIKYKNILEKNDDFKKLYEFAIEKYKNKLVLGSQRALQFGGKPILKHNEKIYNCTATYVDRPTAFQEIMYFLLCGCGVGFSVQNKHINKLPKIKKRSNRSKVFVIEDSIEGWSDAIGVLISSYIDENAPFPKYQGCHVNFDYSNIRPKGSMISGGFKAPGHEGLRKSIIKIEELIENELKNNTDLINIRSIVAYDIIMHMSDAVLSGGVRRSATLAQFSINDDDMLNAKTGNWNETNPQRARSNNSVVINRNTITKEEFSKIMKSVKEFGEPGFLFLDDEDFVFNPCSEIMMKPQTEKGVSGIQCCNLTEINGNMCVDEEIFYDACKASAIIGTLQAGFTEFNYCGSETKEIVEREALLGCSITGYMNNPEILLNPEIQRNGAKIIKETNKIVANMIGINQAARTTCTKPSGNASILLGTASGIHGEHSEKYFRNVQINKDDDVGQYLREINPVMFEESSWSANNTDWVISFPIEPKENSIFKKDLYGVKLLEYVKLTQQNWVEYGTNENLCVDKRMRHNVSNTIVVDDWDGVENYIFENKKWFAGISLLPMTGDKDYNQAPFLEILTSDQIVKKYGDVSLFASGLIVDALNAFNNNLWKACDAVLGLGEKLDYNEEEISKIVETSSTNELWSNLGFKNGTLETLVRLNIKPDIEEYKRYLDSTLPNTVHNYILKKDWIRRAKQFAKRYFSSNKEMTYCLKDVHNYHRWVEINREIKNIDWTKTNLKPKYTNIDTTGAVACSGVQCEITF
jgi:ribonucleoside-diphosphate reductase alpha chain